MAITILSIVIVLLLIFIPVLYSFAEFKIVDEYYSTKECGHGGSAIGVINKKCECSGLKFDKSLFGSYQAVCFGECKNCECNVWNATTEKREVVNC